jgi:hypothetical protein
LLGGDGGGDMIMEVVVVVEGKLRMRCREGGGPVVTAFPPPLP